MEHVQNILFCPSVIINSECTREKKMRKSVVISCSSVEVLLPEKYPLGFL